MDQGPLVKETFEAGRRFLARFERYAPVRVAFWLLESDGPHWFLYIVSDQINDENFDLAYGEVLRLAGEMQDPDFDPLRVKVLGSDDPVARAALRAHGRGKSGVHLRDVAFADVNASEVQFYPQDSTVPMR